jgi:flagellar biosynthesis repressor protein FlbT
MALKLALKPNEKLIIGGAVITNGALRSTFVIDNSVPILRARDIMSLPEADSPCRRIYFTIQLMYIDEENLADHHRTYWNLVKDVAAAAPSKKLLLQQISEDILNSRYYQAMKLTRKLIAYEQEAIKHVCDIKSN